MASFSVHIEGLEELKAKFQRMKDVDRDKAIAKGLRAGAKMFQAEIASRAPEQAIHAGGDSLPAGALKNDIVVTSTQKREGYLEVDVQPAKYTAHIAMWVEYGHRLVRGGYSHKSRKDPGKYRGKGKQVGAVPAHPFIRPGYEAVAEEATNRIVQVVAAEIEKRAEE